MDPKLRKKPLRNVRLTAHNDCSCSYMHKSESGRAAATIQGLGHLGNQHEAYITNTDLISRKLLMHFTGGVVENTMEIKQVFYG